MPKETESKRGHSASGFICDGRLRKNERGQERYEICLVVPSRSRNSEGKVSHYHKQFYSFYWNAEKGTWFRGSLISLEGLVQCPEFCALDITDLQSLAVTMNALLTTWRRSGTYWNLWWCSVRIKGSKGNDTSCMIFRRRTLKPHRVEDASLLPGFDEKPIPMTPMIRLATLLNVRHSTFNPIELSESISNFDGYVSLRDILEPLIKSGNTNNSSIARLLYRYTFCAERRSYIRCEMVNSFLVDVGIAAKKLSYDVISEKDCEALLGAM